MLSVNNWDFCPQLLAGTTLSLIFVVSFFSTVPTAAGRRPPASSLELTGVPRSRSGKEYRPGSKETSIESGNLRNFGFEEDGKMSASGSSVIFAPLKIF